MNATANGMPTLVLPGMLKKGDTIGLIAPAGPVQNEDDFNNGVKLIRDMGFQVKYSQTVFRKEGYLAGSDIERAKALEEMLLDPETKALLAVRGGYGTLRILPLLNLELFLTHRKILIGFSDISVLCTAVLRQTGLLTFHGPMLTTLAACDRASIEAFFQTLTTRNPASIKTGKLEILIRGAARGPLLGGNLASIVHLLSTRYDLPWQQAILFFEDVNEQPYRIDRLFTQLKEAGKLDDIAGIILGSFTNCGAQGQKAFRAAGP